MKVVIELYFEPPKATLSNEELGAVARTLWHVGDVFDCGLDGPQESYESPILPPRMGAHGSELAWSWKVVGVDRG